MAEKDASESVYLTGMADAVCEYWKTHEDLQARSIAGQALQPDEIRRLEKIAGYCDAHHANMELAALLRMLSTAVNSEEYEKGDLVRSLSVLSEIADLNASAAFAEVNARYLVSQDELRRASPPASTKTRRSGNPATGA